MVHADSEHRPRPPAGERSRFVSRSKHPIYRNALNAIQVGVKDFNEGSPPRLSSAVRNLTAGILLLCKEKLRRLSPSDEILIWKQLKPLLDDDGQVVFDKSGETTVDVNDIIDRFKSCKVDVDTKLLKKSPAYETNWSTTMLRTCSRFEALLLMASCSSLNSCQRI